MKFEEKELVDWLRIDVDVLQIIGEFEI